MKRNWILLSCLSLTVLLVRSVIAQEQAKQEKSQSSALATASVGTANSPAIHDAAKPSASRDFASDERIARVEGEKRFRANCGRCHQPPHKFPLRVMAAAIRHMRVRAMLTDEDMKFILRYMTQ